jgi:acyl-CoA synthetase (AMP-forming)/AMP-acid ligase II
MANNESVGMSFGHDASSTFVSWLPCFHDMGLVGSIAQPMYLGAPSYFMAPLDFVRNPIKWLRAIDRYNGHTGGGPNFGYDLCVERVRDEEKRELDLSRWTVAFCGAEPVHARTIDRFCGAFGSRGFARTAFFPCYGLAENTVFVSGGPAQREPRITNRAVNGVARELVSCGPAGYGVTICIVSPENGQVLPEGNLGEIWVGGTSKADMYFNDAVLSAERLNAYTTAGDGPFLRTGDLGLLLDNELYIAGRCSDMIIVRGRNIFPEDVEETAKSALPSWSCPRAAAFGVDGDAREELVLVMEVAERMSMQELEAATHSIKNLLFEELELTLDRLVFVKRGRIPVTTSGKIRRGECRSCFLNEQLIPINMLDAARRHKVGNAIEGEVIAITSEILGVRLSAAHLCETPVALGMDSIRVALLAFRLETRFGVISRLADLATTALGQIAAGLAKADVKAKHSAQVTLQSNDVIEPSIGQSAFVYMHRVGGTHRRHMISFVVRVHHDVSVTLLRNAIEGVLRTHRQLLLHGTPLGMIASNTPSITLTRHANTGAALRIARKRAETPIALDDAPLADFVIDTGTDGTFLTLRLHHYVTDLWSIGIIFEDLDCALRGHSLATSAEYAEFVQWQRAYLGSSEGHAALDRWRARLYGNAGFLELPLDRPRPPQQTREAGQVRFRLGEETATSIYAVAAELQCTPFSILVAAYAGMLTRYASCQDVVIGVPAFGRPSARFSRTIGLFTNTLPMRFSVSAETTFRQLVENVHHETLACLDDQFVPFASIVSSVNTLRTPGASSLFQTMFTLQGGPPGVGRGLLAGAIGEKGSSINLGGAPYVLEYVPPLAVDVDLDLAVVCDQLNISGYLAYNRDVFTRRTAGRMLDGMKELLCAGLVNPNRRVELLPVYPVAYDEQVKGSWATSSAVTLPSQRVEQLFLEQADERPYAIAVVDDENAYTYGSLQADSAQLAQCLRAVLGT